MPDNELAPLVKMWRRYERYKAYCALLQRPALTFSDYRARIWSIAVSCLTAPPVMFGGRARINYGGRMIATDISRNWNAGGMGVGRV